MQTAKKVLMVRPAMFAYNEQTAKNNFFQEKLSIPNLNEKALKEFDRFVKVLRRNKIEVVIVQDTSEPHTPDSIFPNNWFSTHPTSELVLFPMFAQNRRLERKSHVLDTISKNYIANKTINLTDWENKNKFLEGTGSLILDHNNRIAYACHSERTDENVFENFCTKMNFTPIFFNTHDENNNAIYHTNIMLSIGDKIAIICSEAISDKKQKDTVLKSLKKTKEEVIEISFEQMKKFCGNVLEVLNSDNKNCLIMSDLAKQAFTRDQKRILDLHLKIVSSSLSVIEQIGGGSARCMIAEIF